MPNNLAKQNVNPGKVIYEWWVNEYEKFDRSRRWYIISAALGIGMLVYALVSTNYLFALLIVLFAIVLYLHELQEPVQVYFAITNTGIILGKKYYRYSELKNFWVLYSPPEVKNLYFSLDNLVKHRLQIPLLDYDPRPIRNCLAQYLAEDLEQNDEPATDKFARIFKLH